MSQKFNIVRRTITVWKQRYPTFNGISIASAAAIHTGTLLLLTAKKMAGLYGLHRRGGDDDDDTRSDLHVRQLVQMLSQEGRHTNMII